MFAIASKKLKNTRKCQIMPFLVKLCNLIARFFFLTNFSKLNPNLKTKSNWAWHSIVRILNVKYDAASFYGNFILKTIT